MRVRYRHLDLDALRTLEALRRLFRELLLRTNGDVAEAIAWMRQLQRRGLLPAAADLDAFLAALEAAGKLERDGSGQLVVAGAGERELRQAALAEVFGPLRASGIGRHPTGRSGRGEEALTETRPWVFGDALDRLAVGPTLRNALRRAGPDDLTLAADDLEVAEVEHQSACATVLAIDISHSMVLYGEDRFTPAKKLALALVELIETRYPKDTIDVVLFGDDARQVPIARLSRAAVGPFHTNTKAGLELSADLLRHRRHANKQIVMITDGKPSCIEERGQLYKNPFGLDLKIVNRTLAAADRCRRDGIALTTIMLATEPALVDFVETLSRVARGRAFFASPDGLAEMVLADFVKNRRRRVR